MVDAVSLIVEWDKTIQYLGDEELAVYQITCSNRYICWDQYLVHKSSARPLLPLILIYHRLFLGNGIYCAGIAGYH